MHLVQEPVDELVRVVMLIVIEEGIGRLQCQDKSLVIKGPAWFLIA